MKLRDTFLPGEVVTRVIANLVLFLGGAVLVVAVQSLFAVARA